MPLEGPDADLPQAACPDCPHPAHEYVCSMQVNGVYCYCGVKTKLPAPAKPGRIAEEAAPPDVISLAQGFAMRVIDYFGTGPIDPKLDVDIFLRQKAYELRDACQKAGACAVTLSSHGDYRKTDCENCGRMRVEKDGICEKCKWNNDTHQLSSEPNVDWEKTAASRGKQVQELEEELIALRGSFCPPHLQLFNDGHLEPLDNCVVCIRNERDELRRFYGAESTAETPQIDKCSECGVRRDNHRYHRFRKNGYAKCGNCGASWNAKIEICPKCGDVPKFPEAIPRDIASPAPAATPDHETIEANLSDVARKCFDAYDMYKNAWLREMGGVIRPKWHEIDGFVLRMRDIYQKAQCVDRIKQIMSKELKREGATKDSLFDAVFKFLAEDGHDEVPTN
jgi:uncharacterized OB-fold protein